jgi:hypothetical protein
MFQYFVSKQEGNVDQTPLVRLIVAQLVSKRQCWCVFSEEPATGLHPDPIRNSPDPQMLPS